MERIALKMKLNEGCQEEYLKRHDEIWLELKDLLKEYGISNYSIFFDKQTNDLFAYLNVEDSKKLDLLPQHPIMQKWWKYMSDIMETNPDNSPKTIQLNEVFFLK